MTQSFGSGGSGDVSAANQTLSLTTTWQKFTKTFTLDSISGKTLVAGNYLDLQFGSVATSTFTIDIAQVQVESGSIATPFEQRPIQVEEAMCQRYYETGIFNFTGYQQAGAGYGQMHPFKVTKFAAPIMTTSGVGGTNVTTLSLSGLSTGFTNNGYATTTGVVNWGGTYQASAEL